MTYWKLIFKAGPWDGQELEIDRDPVKVELNVAAGLKRELWNYEPGIRDGEKVYMMGSVVGG